MPIRPLPPLLVNQIAAGEVIERPASVVKELVENSLDAGATRVDVAVEDGGRQAIRVSDNGAGIASDELPLAVAPHATSKLTAPEQLMAIGTLGFRGEALASIASVSRLRITSRATVDGAPLGEAAVIEASGERVGSVMPAAASPGTVIEVRDLFFNTPARRKFMRAAGTEFGHISDLMNRIAMAHPQVGFSLSHNGRKTLDLPPEASRRRRCLEILGKELDEGLLEFEDVEAPQLAAPAQKQPPQALIWGLAGLPSIARATTRFQYLCVNGRPVRDRQIAHAIKEAYRGLIPPDRQPVAVVFVEIDPEAVDVNVHPGKAEVRFRESGRVHGLVLGALRQRLRGSDLTPSAQVGGTGGLPASGLTPGGTGDASHRGSPDDPPPFVFDADETPWSAPPTPVGSAYTGDGLATTTTTAAPASSGQQARGNGADSFVDYFRRMDPKQKGFVYQQVRAEMEQASRAEGSELESAWQQAEENQTAPPAVLRNQGVLQVHQSYLVTQDEQGLLIVDQHALHERVMFEQLRRRILESQQLESQRLLMPAVVPGDSQRQALLEDLRPLLERIGIEADPIGPGAIGIQAFPSLLFERKVDPAEFMEELLDRAAEGDFDMVDAGVSEAALHEVLDMMACKAAIKAGDGMSPEELAELLRQREAIERSSNCPHGRPTTLRLSLRDLEKQFGRG